MNPWGGGAFRLSSFVLASLLIHSGLLLALPGLLAWQADREPPPAVMTVQYLDFVRNEQEGAKETGAAAGAPAASQSAAESLRRGNPALAASVPISTPLRIPAPASQLPMANPEPGVTEAAPIRGATVTQATEVAPARGAAKPLGAGAVVARQTEGRPAVLPRAGAPMSGEPGSWSGAAGSGSSRQAGGAVTGSPRGGDPAVHTSYHARLKSLIEAHKQYPLAARKSGQQGSCLRRFALGRDGTLKRVEALSSCGHPFLDGAATRAITAVGTFPPLPEAFPGAEESFSITITFTLARQ